MNSNERLPRLSECFVALGRGGHDVRHATVLVDRGDTVIIEYRTGGAGHERGLDHVCKIVKRSQVTPYSGGRKIQIVRED